MHGTQTSPSNTGCEQLIQSIARYSLFPLPPSLSTPGFALAADHRVSSTQGLNYMREGNFTNAYLFYLRYSALVLDYVGKHPDAQDPASKAALKPLLKRMPHIFDQLEQLRPHIDKTYQEWLRASVAQRDAERDAQQSQKPLTQYQKHAARDPALSWNPAAPSRVLDAWENQDLAVDLAKKEISRRDAARRATRQAGISYEEEQSRRGAGVWDDWQGWGGNDYMTPSRLAEEQEVRKSMESTRQLLSQRDVQAREGSEASRQSLQPSSRAYHYPSIHKPAPLQYPSHPTQSRQERETPQPPRPPKEDLQQSPSRRYDSAPPALPEKGPLFTRYEALHGAPTPTPPVLPEGVPKLPAKTIDSKAKKERYTFRPAAYLESGKPIRPVFLPDKLRETFLDIASENTRKGLEMCGMLCGTPVNNALFISCLLIPEQKCTSDTCETENESSMLDYCINQDLLLIGWIHTHPTQTCFMSSRDLHTQAGYQVMMPESIAIVCSPRHSPS